MMDEKMKAAFDAWVSENARLHIEQEEVVEWTLDYLRSQQGPVAWRYKKEGGGWFVSDNEPQYVEQWNDIEEIQPLYSNPIPSAHDEFKRLVLEARRIWMEENPVEDGTDHVTPFDRFFYGASIPSAPAVPEWFEWPHPPKRKQSSCLFDDGYEEGWAECISTLRSRLAAPSPTEKES